MQQRTAAEFTFTAGSAETKGERHAGLDLEDGTNPQFASALALVGELRPFLQRRSFSCPPTRILSFSPPRCLDYTETAVVLTNKAG